MGNLLDMKAAFKAAIEEWEKAHAFPPEVHFKRFHVPPSGWEYIGPDDVLQITIYTTASTTGLSLALRQLTSDGREHYMQESLDGVATSTLTTKRYKLAEGWLIGACVSNLGGGLADQVCWVSMALQRGVKSGTVPHTILQQGYITNLISVSWPPTFSRGPATGSGVPNLSQYNLNGSGAGSIVPGGANDIRVALFYLPANVTFSNILVEVNAADAVGLYSWGIYDISGNLKAAIAAATVPSTGAVSRSVTGAPITLPAGNYIFAFTGNANTAALAEASYTTTVTALASWLSSTSSSAGALPPTIAVPAFTGSSQGVALPQFSLL